MNSAPLSTYRQSATSAIWTPAASADVRSDFRKTWWRPPRVDVSTTRRATTLPLPSWREVAPLHRNSFQTHKARRSKLRQLDELGRISTIPTMLRPLIAMAILPSRVGIMWRTIPPPLGICHVWNFSVLGSNRTRLYGRVFDSTYQILSSITVMP